MTKTVTLATVWKRFGEYTHFTIVLNRQTGVYTLYAHGTKWVQGAEFEIPHRTKRKVATYKTLDEALLQIVHF